MCGIIRIWFVLQTSTSFFYGFPGKCFVVPQFGVTFILGNDNRLSGSKY